MIKKFIKTALLFLGPIIIIAFSIEEYLQYYPSIFQIKAYYINSHKKNIEILVLGSSHNQVAVNPHYFAKENVANLSFGGQDLQLDSKLLDKYITELPNLKYVLFELAYHTLESMNGPEYDRNNLYLRFYGINNFDRSVNLHDYSIFVSHPKLYLSFLNPFAKKTPINKYGFETDLSDFEKELHTFKNANFNAEIINKNRNNFLITRHKYEDIKSYERNKIIFEKMLAKCVNHNITPIIMIPPVYITYYEEMLPAKKQRRDDLIKYCMNKYPSVLLFNYEYSSEFLVTDFINEDHLDPEGAKKFSLKLDSFIKATTGFTSLAQ